jgi:hypothetical protein
MTLCDQVQLIEGTSPTGLNQVAAAEWSQGNVHWFHGAKLVVPSARDESQCREEQTKLFWRFLCHYFVDQIPDNGIQDVCQSLRDSYDYYRPAEPTQQLLPQSNTRIAKMGVRSVRPEFTVDGE